ncbi:tripartite tricarboxylate transporter TctB family protein [Alkalibacillus haloalkaliphilus]|uniref:Membrane protein n=1 Tax=Alkalibacillus haloalkaliphilus TaxID=94136 RepID=A0A511W0A2_9BACI|nr:tripartite tricarboxylate transporter TctB family protein [Alkalibacillus haloalkaliphilus]MDV2581418.1 tripartite tricarboxylate transporter TctB family protein [Alkalibacillus haloalkaliphilus]GEN44486.1 membrane protein [Alkalibacillus haloalkaliphilus]
MLNNVNRKIGLVLFLISAGYLFMSYQLPTYPYIPVDADAIPKTLGWILLVLSIALFFSEDKDSEEQKAKRHIPKKDVKAISGVFVLALIFITLLEIVGFLIMTALFIFSSSKFLGYENNLVNAIVSVCFPLFLYSIFVFLLNINLPQGVMPF